jgi:hypothetical protein
MCTLYKGVPFGLAVIQYTHPNDEIKSFRGVGFFNDRQLHDGPFMCISGLGLGYSFTKMLKGRPAENSFCSFFNNDEHSHFVESLDKMTDVSGWQCYSG